MNPLSVGPQLLSSVCVCRGICTDFGAGVELKEESIAEKLLFPRCPSLRFCTYITMMEIQTVQTVGIDTFL